MLRLSSFNLPILFIQSFYFKIIYTKADSKHEHFQFIEAATATAQQTTELMHENTEE